MTFTPAKPVLVVAGPTASGKSALALRLAEEFGGTIINADSMQVYRELRILTARPTTEDEAKCPHRLYGDIRAADPYSAGRWVEDVEPHIADAQSAGRLTILVGGTGLYLKALIDGLDEMPEIPDDIRQAVRGLHDQLGTEGFYNALKEKDPVMAARLQPADRQRLIRAYEVFLSTGQSLAAFQSGRTASPARRAKFKVLLVQPSREALYAACDARVPQMIAAGALDEVRALLDEKLDPHLPGMKALGVQPLREHLEDGISLDEAIFATRKSTRNFAKRQMTWFRGQLAIDETFIPDHINDPNAQFSESYIEKIFSFVRECVLTAQ